MEVQSVEQLASRKCIPCEGGVEPATREHALAQLAQLTGWQLTDDGQRIGKQWTVKSFLAGLRFFNRVAELAEQEGHHPDLHLSEYRHVRIEIWTHAIGGLSESDFILAAKIDQLPIT